MITFTDEAWARVMDRLNNGRQMVQWARVDSARRHECIEQAHRILTECEAATKAGMLTPDGPDAEPWALDDQRIEYEQREATELRERLAAIPGEVAYDPVRYAERVVRMTQAAMDKEGDDGR